MIITEIQSLDSILIQINPVNILTHFHFDSSKCENDLNIIKKFCHYLTENIVGLHYRENRLMLLP